MRARLDILILFIDKAVFVMSLLRASNLGKFRIAPSTPIQVRQIRDARTNDGTAEPSGDFNAL